MFKPDCLLVKDFLDVLLFFLKYWIAKNLSRSIKVKNNKSHLIFIIGNTFIDSTALANYKSACKI